MSLNKFRNYIKIQFSDAVLVESSSVKRLQCRGRNEIETNTRQGHSHFENTSVTIFTGHKRAICILPVGMLMIFMWKMWTCSRVVAAAAIDQCETGRKRPLQSHLSHHHQHHHLQQHHHHHQHHHHPQQHQCHHFRFVDFVIAVKLGVLSSKGQRLRAHFFTGYSTSPYLPFWLGAPKKKRN